MSRDEPGLRSRDHRAGSRLASSRPDNRKDIPRRQRVPPAPKPDPRIDLDGVVSNAEYYTDQGYADFEEPGRYDPSEAARREMGGYQQTNGNGYHPSYDEHYNEYGNDYGGGPRGGYQTVEPTYDPPGSSPAPVQPYQPPEDDDTEYQEVYPQRSTTPGELSKQEQQLLLMHTIQLYDDEWRLACIRTSRRKNWLVAFLIPRNKPIDLQQAISKQLALRITVDSRGNTDVSLPKKRGFLHRLLTWLRGA